MIKKLSFFYIFFIYIFINSTSPIFPNKTMKIVYYDSFPPYSWHDGDGIMKGLLVDISDAVLSEMGINVEHRGYPWGRAQNLVQNNKADAFITIATFDRKKYTYTSKEPVINGPITIFTSIKNPRLDEIKNIEEINDLKNFKILDYIGNGWGNSNLKDFDRSLVPNLSNALQMISAGRGDIVATDNMVAYYLMRHLELESQLIEIPILLDEVSFSLCIGKNSEYSNILDDFDKHMKKFRDSGKMNEIIELYTK